MMMATGSDVLQLIFIYWPCASSIPTSLSLPTLVFPLHLLPSPFLPLPPALVLQDVFPQGREAPSSVRNRSVPTNLPHGRQGASLTARLPV